MPANTGNALKAARLKRGLSQEEVCYRLRDLVPEHYRLTQSSLARIESGAIADPEPLTVAALCDIYKVSIKRTAPAAYEAIRTMWDNVLVSLDLTPRSSACNPVQGVPEFPVHSLLVEQIPA